jgi:hypothetical protein
MSALSLEALVLDLTPIRRVRPGHGMLLIGSGVLLAVAVALFWLGPRPHLAMVFLHPFGLGRSALLLGLGVVAATELVAMARPRVGRTDRIWRWGLALALLLPALTLAYGAGQERPLAELMALGSWAKCLGTIAMLSVGVAAFIIVWLRRGAPTDLARAGWLTGLAAGTFGAFAYSLHCPHNGMAAIAIWYSLSVVACALVGRIVVPPLIRW